MLEFFIHASSRLDAEVASESDFCSPFSRLPYLRNRSSISHYLNRRFPHLSRDYVTHRTSRRPFKDVYSRATHVLRKSVRVDCACGKRGIKGADKRAGTFS